MEIIYAASVLHVAFFVLCLEYLLRNSKQIKVKALENVLNFFHLLNIDTRIGTVGVNSVMLVLNSLMFYQITLVVVKICLF